MKLYTILSNCVEDLAVLASNQSIEKHCHLKMASLEISNQIANYPYKIAIARKITTWMEMKSFPLTMSLLL